MKLCVKREQEEKKGFFGGSKGVSFLLSCRVELDGEEKGLIEKYKQWDLPVYEYESVKGMPVSWSVRQITSGASVSCDGVGALLAGEEQIKEACNNLKVMLRVMSSFGGEDVYEI